MHDELYVEDFGPDTEEYMVVYPEEPSPDTIMEMHAPDTIREEFSPETMRDVPMLEVESPMDVDIVVSDLPGVDQLDPELEQKLEVIDEDPASKEDENEAKKSSSKKPPKWDWESKGAQGFVHWVKERLSDVPKHSGYDTAGIERAISYLEKLDAEISKAMRLDLDGELDADKIEEVRSKLDDGIERLHDRLDKVKSKRKGKKSKKAELESALVKEGQKSTRIDGIVITVPLLISRVARVCINGSVSAGHDMAELFEKQVKAYKLNEREQAEVVQLLADMGHPMRQDRGYLVGEEVDERSTDNLDWAANYQN